MADAYKCDLTGKLVEGTMAHSFLAPINENVALLIYPQRKADERHFVPGAISPEMVEKIKAALAKLGTK